MIKLHDLGRFTLRVLSGCCLLAATTFTVHAQQLTFTTFAGPAGGPGSADGTGSAARFDFPVGVATDSGGNVYVSEWGNNTIRKITPAGVVTTLAGSAGLSGSADGIGSAARFALPAGVATDSGGNVYVAEWSNHTIRKITPAGLVTTLAGSPRVSGSVDGTGSAARFNSPTGVATDSGGNVFVADSSNSTIRKITPAGVVTTLAGSAGLSGIADGTGSAARFSGPQGVATDSRGNVFVADTFNNKIRVGRPALADSATIDFSTGTVGTTRRISTSAQTATSWQWTLIRRPSASTATLSSTSIRNPVFTPDVPDLYIFQLTASNGVRTSITTISLTATPVSSRPTLGRSLSRDRQHRRWPTSLGAEGETRRMSRRNSELVEKAGSDQPWRSRIGC